MLEVTLSKRFSYSYRRTYEKNFDVDYRYFARYRWFMQPRVYQNSCYEKITSISSFCKYLPNMD